MTHHSVCVLLSSVKLYIHVAHDIHVVSFVIRSDIIAAFTVGRATLAGASLVGLGALCYYGLGLSNDVGAIDRAA